MALPLLSAVRVWHKLLLLGVIALLLCALPTLLYIQVAGKQIDGALNELQGLPPATEIVRLMQPMQAHFGLAAAVLGGDQTLARQRAVQEKEVTAAWVKVRAALPPEAEAPVKLLDKVEAEWLSLVNALKDKNFRSKTATNAILNW